MAISLIIFQLYLSSCAAQMMMSGMGMGGMGGMGMGGMGMGMGMGTGQCTFDQNCWFYAPSSTIKAIPFLRRDGISCEECLGECMNRKSGNGTSPYCCMSVVYDATYKTCDLFAVNCQMPKYKLTKCPGRIYLQPTGMPGCGAATQAPNVSVALCKEGETSKIMAVKDYELSGFSGQEVSGADADACGKACLTGKLPDGSAFECHAAQFKDGKCTVSKEAKTDIESGLKKASGSTFYQQLCLPTDLVKSCPDIFYEAPQYILVGQNTQTVDAGKFSECVRMCLEAPKLRGFTCTSGIFYYQEKQMNCILNKENSKTKPDLYIEQQEDIETYFELNCAAGAVAAGGSKKRMKAFKDAFMDLPEMGPWAHWSSCKGRHSNQYRFRQCRQMDSRDCPKEDRSCNPLHKLTTTTIESPVSKKKPTDERLINDQMRARDAIPHGECRAVILAGKKNCKMGQRTVNGKKELCLYPVDC